MDRAVLFATRPHPERADSLAALRREMDVLATAVGGDRTDGVQTAWRELDAALASHPDRFSGRCSRWPTSECVLTYDGSVSTCHADSVTFSDLSRNPRAVAERAARLGRLRVTHRDAPDFYLTAADREDQRDQTLATASRLFLALMKHDPTARTLVIAMPEVFPWVHHLSTEELRAFTLELVEALSDAAELDVDATTQEVISGWRATARIKADPALYAEARKPTSGDFGAPRNSSPQWPGP